jgi:hypothetical protein
MLFGVQMRRRFKDEGSLCILPFSLLLAGKTLEEARRNAAEALTLNIDGIVEDGEEIPD